LSKRQNIFPANKLAQWLVKYLEEPLFRAEMVKTRINIAGKTGGSLWAIWAIAVYGVVFMVFCLLWFILYIID
jgi:hypothetical protein